MQGPCRSRSHFPKPFLYLNGRHMDISKLHPKMNAMQRTEVVKDQEAKCLLSMELRLLGQAKILHGCSEGVEIPFM